MKRSGIFRFFAGVCLVFLASTGVFAQGTAAEEYRDGIGSVSVPDKEVQEEDELYPGNKKSYRPIIPPTIQCDLASVDLVVRNNMLLQTEKLENGVTVRYVVYPLVKAVKDPMYWVVYVENTSEKILKDQVAASFVYGAVSTWRITSPESQENVFRPGEKRLYWFVMTPDKMPMYYWKQRGCPYERQPYGKIPVNTFGSFDYVQIKNIYYDSRSPEERALIERTAVGGFSLEFLGYELDFDLRGTTEEDFSSPSTFRDEVHLTRLIGEYLKAEETECAGKMQAVLDLVRSFPYPQRILMTYRLAMLDEEKVSERVRQNRETFSPTERVRLDRLSRALEELREKTVDEGVTFPETNYADNGLNPLWYIQVVGCFNSTAQLGLYSGAHNMILIFNDRIYGIDDASNHYSFDQLQELILLHEIVHAFNYDHDLAGLMRNGLSASLLANTPVDYSLTKDHVLKIQSTDLINVFKEV